MIGLATGAAISIRVKQAKLEGRCDGELAGGCRLCGKYRIPERRRRRTGEQDD